MYQIAGIVLLLLAPPAAFFTPFLRRHPKVRQAFASLRVRLPRVPVRVGFQPLDLTQAPAPTPAKVRRNTIIEGCTLVLAILGVVLSTGAFPDNRGTDFARLRNALLGGAALGALAIFAVNYLRSARLNFRCARSLRGFGLRGAWCSSSAEDAPLSFRDALLRETNTHKQLDITSGNGLDVLAALSHPAHNTLEAPHPALAGTTIRLLLVPPRSGCIDPERKRSSCAEEALVRLKVSPEQHWRDLQRTMEVANNWAQRYGVSMQVRFVEVRPSLHAVISGPRAWFRPWVSSGQTWMEAADTADGSNLHELIRDSFLSAWGTGAQELSYTLEAGPTGSTFIRKGVESTESSYRLTEA